MKIISGKYKHTTIPTIQDTNYRPSTTKFREALFSILSSGVFDELQPVVNARVLDVFAGTGALAFEALSRAAQNITLIDNNKLHLKLAEDFARKLNCVDRCTTLLMNATLLAQSTQQYDLIFIDPPYYDNLINKTLMRLMDYDWIAKSAIIVIEMHKQHLITIPPNFELLIERKYSISKLLILIYKDVL